MHKAQLVTGDDVVKIAKLANLKVQESQVQLFADQFNQTVDVINQLNEVDTQGVAQTYQVNNLINVSREDTVDTSRMLTQEQALSQAKQTNNGFFVVKRVIDTAEEL